LTPHESIVNNADLLLLSLSRMIAQTRARRGENVIKLRVRCAEAVNYNVRWLYLAPLAKHKGGEV